MGQHTKIQWTDHTFNPWIGCQKASTGCENCYAETYAMRFSPNHWGPHQTRRPAAEITWTKPRHWNKTAERTGRRAKVLCASLADVFDSQGPSDLRNRLWQLVRETPHLDWQVLTKLPQNLPAMLPDTFPQDYPNLWLGISAENQEEYDRRWPLLAHAPATILFVAYEPALGPLTVLNHDPKPDWLIWAGESGRKARTMNAQWARNITAECLQLQIPVYAKQWGTYRANPLVAELQHSLEQAKAIDPPQNGPGGALLDGTPYRQLPTAAGRQHLPV